MSKPMTLNEIAIDDEMNQMRDRIQRLIRERDEARADNARLTARVAELERENKSITVSFLSEHDRADDLASRETWYNSEIERLHAALDAQPAVLTPRNCIACRKAAEAMREAAADLLMEHSRKLMIVGNGDPFSYDGFAAIAVKVSSKKIRALPLPSFGAEQCAGCAPLKPEA